jgi:hypothetical protein
MEWEASRRGQKKENAMQLENAQAVAEHLNGEGTDAEVRENYSGRGMYGESTAAVVTPHADDVAHAMGLLGIADSRRVDNMGLGYVVY